MLLDLTSSNPTSASPFYPHDEIREAFSALQDFVYRPDPFGLEEGRAAIERYYADQGYSLPISRIALTASTSEAYGLLFKLLCDPGDEVLVPVPSYPLFEYLAALENVKPIQYPLRYDGGWYIDFQALRDRISSRSRLIVIVNPNNPTGSYLKNLEWEMLSEVATENGLPVLSDEVFMNYEFGNGEERVKTLIDKNDALSFSLNGLSKAAGMPQMKVAWIVINGPENERQIARERLEVLLDTYLSVNTPVQLALPALLRTGSRVRDYLQSQAKANLEEAWRLLKHSPVHMLHTEGGWSLILQLPQTRREEEWLAGLLEEENVVLQPGFFFDMPSEAYAVASLIVDPTVFREGIGRLQRYVTG